MPENRSCPEYIPNICLEAEFKLLVNCANCTRWLTTTLKCREMIWMKEWVEWIASQNASITRL